MSDLHKAQGVHFVGSAPYATAEETFTRFSSALPGRLRRMPDGETGDRDYWTWWLFRCFPDWSLSPISYPAKMTWQRGEPVPSMPFYLGNQLPAPERKAGDEMVVTPPTDFVKDAVSSYQTFSKLKQEGKIEPSVRFQVSLPTAAASVCTHILPPYKNEAEAAFEPLLMKAVQDIQEAIPASDLAIQWDFAIEMGLLEYEFGRSPAMLFAWFEKDTAMQEVVSRTLRHIEAVREPVELGFHFCYGDIGHQHWAEPQDTSVIVSFFNEIKKGAQRPINWIHLPVPVSRDDEAYLQPLTTANLDPSTELYIGLLREQDPEGSQRRLATAKKVISRPFGVATECGMARIGSAALGDDILKIAADITEPF